MIEKATSAKRSGSGRLIAASVVMLALAGYGFWKLDQDRQRKIRAEVSALSDAGLIRLHDQQWEQAREIFQKIEALQPGSEAAANGLREVEAALQREKLAFLDHWHGLARKAFEAKRWEEATAAAKSVLEEFADDAEARETLKKATAASWREHHAETLAEGRQKLQARNWDGAVHAAETVIPFKVEYPEDKALQDQAKALRNEALAAKQQAEADRLKARALFDQAKAADQGKYDKQLAGWLREAAALAPEDTEIAALLAKVSAYTRTLRIPGDFATPAEAMVDLQDRDVLVIAAGVWKGPLILDKSVELRGAGADTTILECPATESCAISFGPGAKGAKVGGITFRHQSVDSGAERFSAALVRGGEVAFENCVFTAAGGHGLMAIEGGKVSALRCKFAGNGWDGAAASGHGAVLDVRESEASGNHEHGLDVWGGAAAVFTGNRCSNNGRNGIQIDSPAMVDVTANRSHGNREFGLVLENAAGGRVTQNICEANSLGGLVVRLTAAKVEVAKNRLLGNAGPGLALEKGVPDAGYRAANELPADPASVQTDVDFSAPEVSAP